MHTLLISLGLREYDSRHCYGKQSAELFWNVYWFPGAILHFYIT